MDAVAGRAERHPADRAATGAAEGEDAAVEAPSSCPPRREARPEKTERADRVAAPARLLAAAVKRLAMGAGACVEGEGAGDPEREAGPPLDEPDEEGGRGGEEGPGPAQAAEPQPDSGEAAEEDPGQERPEDLPEGDADPRRDVPAVRHHRGSSSMRTFSPAWVLSIARSTPRRTVPGGQ